MLKQMYVGFIDPLARIGTRYFLRKETWYFATKVLLRLKKMPKNTKTQKKKKKKRKKTYKRFTYI